MGLPENDVGQGEALALGITIGITPTTLGFIKNAMGASGFIVRISNGSNGANNLGSIQARPSINGTTRAKGGYASPFGGYNLAGLTNGTFENGLQIWIPSDLAASNIQQVWPWECAEIVASMLTAPSNGCNVHAWPFFVEGPGASRLEY